MIEPKNLLIVRTDRIGDVILSLPLASIIKKHLPNCKITFLVRQYTKALVENHPFIDNIILLEEKNGKIPLTSNIKKISRYKFDSAVIVYPTFITALIIFLSRINNRIGTGYRWYSFLFNQKIYEHRKYAEKHELEYNVNLLTKFGIKEDVNPDNISFNLKPNSESLKNIEKILSESEINTKEPIIIIHPGSGGSSVDLPLEKFKLLTEKIADELTGNIILTGSSSEKELCENLRVKPGILNLAGKLNLSGVIALISRCSIFIANSTGPIHIAAALDKYTIGFYPRIPACSEQRWGPYTNKKVIFSPKIECSNCTREQCNSLNCMNSIEVNDIFFETEKIYKFIQADWRK
jgi:lipopolysaccharide heptosyltransferase II